MLEALEVKLQSFFDQTPKDLSEIDEAMAYSLLQKGKRLRALLVLLVLDALGQDWHKGLYPACAIEMIHTYSLIHDDLPSMDDDDWRRGQLSNHKVFGEGKALLAGDGLLTLAFGLLVQGAQEGCYGAGEALTMVELLSHNAGRYGMIGGQILDLQGCKTKDENRLKRMHSLKTGALLTASFLFGAILAQANESELAFWRNFGTSYGLLFQIQDDLMDVLSSKEEMGKSPGQDTQLNKMTYVSVFGLEESKNKAEEIYLILKRDLENSNVKKDELLSLLRELKDRKK